MSDGTPDTGRDHPAPEPPDAMEAPSPPGVVARLLQLFLGGDRRIRIRVGQWLVTVPVYLGGAGVLAMGATYEAFSAGLFGAWCGYVAVVLAGVYAALRSGWSARFEDASLTAAQIVFGIVAVDWAYAIVGPARSVALYPLLMAFIYGAFSLHWRTIAALTGFALASLLATIIGLNIVGNGAVWSFDDPGFRLDLINAAMVAILLPMLSLGSMRLSSLRLKLRAERSALAGALLEVQRLATHDELTGLANRRDMQHRLDVELARCERFGHPFSIAVIDLDHFKRINDAHGHAGGDEVLRTFAGAASRTLRATDVLGRWGGEEFLLLMPGTQATAARCSVERVLSKVLALPESEGPAVSFSAGVVEYRPGETIDQVVARADEAMYQAKRAGRGQVIQS